MPVVVTGADTPLGRLVMNRLVETSLELDLDLRATVDDREAALPLVTRGVKTAVSDLVDTERFGAVVENAHTVIHLRGVDAGRILDGIPDVIAALPDSGVERIVTLSGFGLEDHPSLAQLRDTGLDVVVLRVGVILAPLDDPDARRPDVVPRSVLVAPMHVDQLADALVRADHLRELHGFMTIDAVGRDAVTSAQLDSLLGTRRGLLDRLGRRAAARPEMVGDAGEGLERILGIRPMPLADAARDVTTRGRSPHAP